MALTHTHTLGHAFLLSLSGKTLPGTFLLLFRIASSLLVSRLRPTLVVVVGGVRCRSLPCWVCVDQRRVTVWQGLAGVEMRAFSAVSATGGPPLDKRVHGVDGRRGLRALVAFVRVFLFLAAVLADEGAVLIELSIPALPVVHQAVVALVAPHRAVGRRPAALQRLVVLCVTVKVRKRLDGRLLRKQFRQVSWTLSAVIRNPGATQGTDYYPSIRWLFHCANATHAVHYDRLYCCCVWFGLRHYKHAGRAPLWHYFDKYTHNIKSYCDVKYHWNAWHIRVYGSCTVEQLSYICSTLYLKC